MEQTPPPLAAMSAPEPQINLLKSRLVTFHLVANTTGVDCAFWIGVAVPGKRTPAALLDVQELPALLTTAAVEGVTEDGPLMLSDTSTTPPRFIYLVPRPDAAEGPKGGALASSAQAWTEDVVASLRDWSPPQIGIYLAPEALNAEKGLGLVASILRAGISTLGANDYYLLTSAHGINAVLNAALALKHEVDSEALTVFVYH